MEVKVEQDNKIGIINSFIDNKSEVINSNFQKSRYAKRLKLLAKGILPKEYREKAAKYSKDEHMEYVDTQVEYAKSLKLKRRVGHGN